MNPRHAEAGPPCSQKCHRSATFASQTTPSEAPRPAAAKRRRRRDIAMTSKTSLLASAGICIVCFLSAAGPSQAAPKHKHPVAAANSQLADEVKALKEQVEALQATVQAQAQNQQQTQAQVAASQAQAEQATAAAHAAQAKLDAQIEQIPGTVQTVVAAQPAPTLDKLKYKGITLTLGGFAEAAGIYRSKTLESDISSPFAKIPFENSGLSKLHELRGTARQSRVQ